MKRFIKLMTAFIITLLFASVFLDLYVSWFHRHDDSDMFGKWTDIMCKNLNSDVVMLGNCRASTGISPRIIDSILDVNSYNLGYEGGRINQQVYKFGIYSHFQQKQPKLLIQNIDFNTLKFNNDIPTNIFYPFVFKKGFREDIKKNNMLSFCDMYIPCFRYYKTPFMVRAAFGFKLRRNLTYKGYACSGENELVEEKTGGDPLEYEHTNSAVSFFQAFLEKLNKNGIKVVLVYPPLYHTLTERIVDVDNMRLMYDTIAKKYGAYILDYDTISICYDKTYFNDEGHLNTKCSEYYSLRLANDIKALDLLK